MCNHTGCLRDQPVLVGSRSFPSGNRTDFINFAAGATRVLVQVMKASVCYDIEGGTLTFLLISESFCHANSFSSYVNVEAM